MLDAFNSGAPPMVAVVLVNSNEKEDTLECLASLQRDAYAQKRIFVVDNASTDGSAAAIREAYPLITLLEQKEDLGLSGGNNVGIKAALAEGVPYIYLLKNAMAVDPRSTTHLVRALEADAACGLTCPVTYDYDHREVPWFAGASLDLQNGTVVQENLLTFRRDDPPREVAWAPACAMMLRASILQRLGGFDERFFEYWEDVDLSLRIRATGLAIKIVGQARVFRKCGLKNKRSLSWRGEYHYLRSNLLFVEKHTTARRTRAKWRVLRRAAGRCAHSPNKWKQTRAAGRAFFDYMLRRFGPTR